MTSQDIKQLKESIDAKMQKGFSGNEDKNLSDMADMPGWEVLKRLIESVQYSMIAPITPAEAKEIGSLEMIGAMGVARGLVADTLGSIVALVENTNASQKAERDRKEAEEMEKEEEEGT